MKYEIGDENILIIVSITKYIYCPSLHWTIVKNINDIIIIMIKKDYSKEYYVILYCNKIYLKKAKRTSTYTQFNNNAVLHTCSVYDDLLRLAFKIKID